MFSFRFLRSFRVSLAVDFLDDPERTLKLRDTLISFRGLLNVQTTLPDDKALPFVAPSAGVDRRGNPTKLSGKVTVTVSDDKVLTLTQPDPQTPDDPNSGVIEAAGPLGTAQVKFEDDGDGDQPLVAIVDVEVIAGSTVSLAAPVFGPLRDATDAAATAGGAGTAGDAPAGDDTAPADAGGDPGAAPLTPAPGEGNAPA